MGSKGGGSDSTIRYAPFLESAAETLIARGWDKGYDEQIDNSPYGNYTVVNPDDSFLGTGYVISDFPSIFDMYGKFMAGLDIETLHNQELTDTIYDGPVNDSVDAESDIIDADFDATVYPRFEAGMTTINAASSTGFMMGRAYIEDGKTRALTKYAADLKMHAMDLGHQRWTKHLEWNAQVIAHYLSIVNAYFGEKTQYISTKSQLDTADRLWNFTVLDHQRALIGVLHGAASAIVKKDSGFNRVLSGVLGIASIMTGGGGWLLSALGMGGASTAMGLTASAGAASGGAAGVAPSVIL